MPDTHPDPNPAAEAEPPAPPQSVLLAELDVTRCLVRGEDATAATSRLEQARMAAPDPTPLDRIAAGFGLSEFERSVLLLAAGPELVGQCAAELAAASGSAHLTFALALRVLPQAHWSALTPVAPLRRWRLVQLLDPTSPSRSPIVVDERVLHELLGVGYLDPEVAALARHTEPLRVPAASLIDAAATLATCWQAGHQTVLVGVQPANLEPVAASAARAVDRALWILAPEDLPREPPERERLLRLLERESVLSRAAWAFDLRDTSGAGQDGAAWALRAMTSLDAPTVALAGPGTALPTAATRVTVPRLPVPERVEVMTALLNHHGVALRHGSDSALRWGSVSVHIDTVRSAARAFDLSVTDLEATTTEAAHGGDLWVACRERARRRFDGLARLVTPHHQWDDLVLPPAQLAQLHGLVDSVRHRTMVNDTWGFAVRHGRGLGTAALFAGASGTGKTLAAEVVAGELGLDLLVVDLSQVVNKYVGETEKNLARVFEAAEDSGAVLLFDEADALFGKRTEVRDSHDRYANLEVGYLLQRVESFRGLAILTTNARNALDSAFLRRLRVIVPFPYPDAAARTELWRRAFPAQTPTADLDPAALAAIDLAGGGIAAAALTAAYLGAARGEVTPEDVAAATAWELAKNGRTSTNHTRMPS
ncbi:MAG: ATP-binding protein [Kineosporiaceae bacterium]|nr:ATP-binding protein [Kineosporiaceae bacterium]MBK7624110.1 ATP-binding protein [Kineosporiaceae bacterium]